MPRRERGSRGRRSHRGLDRPGAAAGAAVGVAVSAASTEVGSATGSSIAPGTGCSSIVVVRYSTIETARRSISAGGSPPSRISWISPSAVTK